MGSRSVDGGALLSACAKAGLGQHQHRRALAESVAQRAQFSDMVVQTSGFSRRFVNPRPRAACAVRSGHVGQYQLTSLAGDEFKTNTPIVERKSAAADSVNYEDPAG